MISTDYVVGSPCWLDLGAPDPGAAADFYHSVFDWDFQPMGDEPGYGVFKVGDRIAGAVGPLTEQGARSAWMIYFNTPDADAATQAVERAGGTVRVAPMDAEEEGRMAQFSDPQGGQFAVWEPRKSQGLDVVNEPGSLSWTELYTTDMPAAKRFYADLFGWHNQDIPLPGGTDTYSLISPSEGGEERMQGGMIEMPEDALRLNGGRPYWHPVFEVADCDATVTKVAEHGGSLQMGPEDAEGVGRLAVCVDPSGADFVVLTPSEG
ncbi:VOC family protein [Streptomyces sp. NPDC047108]|uniref:VOC family protein n=1 Tax=Streptomyces sp. NPDC047108 TaxID=3155025 RepID=UPI0033F4A9A4